MLWDKRDARLELLLWDLTPLSPAAGPCSISASFAEPQGKEAVAEQEVGMEIPSPVQEGPPKPKISQMRDVAEPVTLWPSSCEVAPLGHTHTIHHPILGRAAAQPLPLS